MLMHVRIRENVYTLSDFKTDWCESPISKENFCKLYKLNKDACDFYGDTGELITGDILDCEQVTVLQRPTGGTEILIGLAIASLFVSVGVTVYAVSKARRMSEELAKRQKSSAAVYSYSLRGSTNDKRNNCPIPIILGKVNATGDKAGLQYSTYSTENFQDVHQILCLGYSGKDYNENAEVVPVTVETGDPNTPTLPVGGVVFDRDSKYETPNKNQKEANANPDGYIVRIADSPVDTFDGMFVAAHVGQDPLGTENRPSYYTERAIEISTMMELKGDPDTEHINPETQQLDPRMDFEQFSQTSPHNTTDIYVGIYAPYGYYYTNDDGKKEPASFAYTVQWRAVGSDTWNTASIPGVPGTMNRAMYRNMVHISVPFVEGENNQYEVRVFRPDYEHYYEFDSESGQWRLADAQNCITLSTEVIKFVTRAANNNITGPAGDEKYRHTWPIPYPARYSLLTMKARATDRTNGWLDQVYTEVHLKCRTYVDTPENKILPCDPTMWTIPNDANTNIGTMNNPASVLLYVLTCPQINPHPVKYNQIDWESLRSWWWFCAGRDPNTGEIIYGEDGEPVRNWACNAFITSTMTVAELCELICATGRAHLVMSDNKYSVYIENKTNVITQIFTPRNAWNMVETKSFDDPVTLIKTSFVDEDTEVEENRLTYFQLDPDTGKVDIRDGKATILFDNAEEVLLQEDIYKSESMDIWGVTRAKQVAQLTAYNLYKGYFLRRHYTWECGIESLSCTVGDVVYLANDIFMDALGYGRIKDVEVENNQIVGVHLDESIEIHGNQTYGITIRTGAGDFVQKALFVAKNTGALTQDENHMLVPTKGLPEDETEPVITNYLEFETPLPSNVDVMEGNLFIYQDAEKPGRKVLIESIKPNGDRGATITAVDYMEHLYDVDVSTEIPQFVSNINKYGTGANIGTGHNNWEGTNESAPNRLVRAAQQYYISESKDELIGGTWLDSMPEDYNGYVWTRVKYTYTNGETNYTNPTYNLKESDVDTSFATVPHYLVTSQSTGVTKNTQGWTTTVQSMTSVKKYLWYYETIIFSTGEGSDSDCFIVGVYGDKGDTGATGATGVSITATTDLYAVNNSSSTAPSSGWDDFDDVKGQLSSSNQYLWNKEIVTYSNGNESELTPHLIYRLSIDGQNGQDGQDGADGQDGRDGIGISGIEEGYSYGTASASSDNWGSNPLIPSSTTGQNYVWQRERVVFDTSPVTYGSWSTPHMIAMWIKGDTGTPAYVFDIYLNTETYIRNLRLSGNNPTSVSATVILQGYEGTATVTITTSSGSTITPSKVGDMYTFDVPYTNNYDYIVITATHSVAGEIERIINCDDQTGQPIYLGELSAIPTPSAFDFASFISGDYFSCVQTNLTDGITAGIPYEYNGTSWDAMAFATKEQKVKAFTCLGGMLNSNVTIPSSATLYAWIGSLVAQDASIASLFAKLIEVGNAIYGGNVNLNASVGSRAYGKGFIMDSNGVMEISEGYARDLNVRGALKLWKNNNIDDVGADIEHPALTTVSETVEADPTGVTVANSPVMWMGSSLLSAMNGVARNAINAAAGPFGSKTLSYYVYVNDLTQTIPAYNSPVYPATGCAYNTVTLTIPMPHYVRSDTVEIDILANSGVYCYTKAGGGKICRGLGTVEVRVDGQKVTGSGGHYIFYANANSVVTATFTPFHTSYDPSYTITEGYLQYSVSAITMDNYVTSAGLWLEYSDKSLEKVESNSRYLDRMQMSSPVSFDSNGYRILNDCSNFLNYWTFTDSSSINHTLKSGRTYAITSSGLYILGNAVTGKLLTRKASSVVIIYEYNGTRYDLEITGGNYYQAYGTIKIAQVSTRGVKMMGNYPKRDADDPNGGFDCGNTSYVWDNGYFKSIHYSNINQGSALALKENILPFTKNALELLNQTEIVNYNYKKDKDKAKKIGFIADYTPSELAGENHDRMELDHCVAILIKAIQELSAEVKELKSRLSSD